ncbi:MAG: hypothetical protein HZA51_13895 [Planctomycetes bacterium]|nr:hypothetical protein [Planctomycetota bacterium]
MSQECNNNFIPDECDINTNDPDGDGLVSADVNGNSIPDECESDCNANSIPDAWDITQSTSTDVNSNGIPDECEKDCNANGRPDDADVLCGGGNTCNGIAGSYDCNLNGTPDECEYDCNANGVPDDCDIDPTDPDGDTFVSDDCNGDTMPDECNLTLPPPYGSFDCNENGILDECDIASEFSEDTNSNGVPDECEGGMEMSISNGNPSPNRKGAGSTEAGANDSMDGDGSFVGPDMAAMNQAPNQDAAWEALFDWSFAQCWGPDCELSPSEQFQAYVNKLAELGLIMP